MSDQQTDNDDYFEALELLVKASKLPTGKERDTLIAQALDLDPKVLVAPQTTLH
ncbi:MAG: hypothetical protein ACOYLQ_09030 [Hyphomicrobiaceae bacterium]